jgi:hypothetical protein
LSSARFHFFHSHSKSMYNLRICMLSLIGAGIQESFLGHFSRRLWRTVYLTGDSPKSVLQTPHFLPI